MQVKSLAAGSLLVAGHALAAVSPSKRADGKIAPKILIISMVGAKAPSGTDEA